MSVSVIIPAFNGAATIRRAVDSVLNQSLHVNEIIIADDGSTDDTLQVLSGYGDRVTTVSMGQRSGAAAARNSAIRASSGDHIAFLDADDEWLPIKLATQIPLLGSSERPGLITCNSSWIGPDQVTPLIADYYTTHCPYEGRQVWVNLLRQNFIPTPTVLTRRDVLNDVGLFDETLPVAEDLDLWIRISRKYSVRFSREVLVRFHEREGSLMKEFSSKNMELTMEVVNKCIKRERAFLSNAQVSRILGGRLHDYAYEAYANGECAGACQLSFSSMKYRHRLLKNSLLIVRAVLGYLRGKGGQ